MNRRITLAAAGGALAALILSNVLGAAAAGPYVYGCGTLNWPNTGGTEKAVLTIYNGSAVTANLTHKILSGNGTQLQASVTPVAVPSTSTLSATKTATFSWDDVHGEPSVSSSTVQNSVRVVSDTPVLVSLHIGGGSTGTEVTCMRLDP
jgi:hypothetical protein